MCSPPCKNRAVNRAVLVLRSVQKSCSRSCSLVFSFVQKSCSSLWKLLQTMGQTQYIYIFSNYLHVSMYMWMFCNHRSPQPCLHTFFIVLRRVPPHRFHTFLVNMNKTSSWNSPPCAVYFCHLLSLPSFGNPLKLLWKSVFPVFVREYLPPLMHTFSKNVWNPPPPQFFGLHWVIIYIYIQSYICVCVCVRIIFRFTMIFWIYLYNTKMHLHMYIHICIHI